MILFAGWCFHRLHLKGYVCHEKTEPVYLGRQRGPCLVGDIVESCMVFSIYELAREL